MAVDWLGFDLGLCTKEIVKPRPNLAADCWLADHTLARYKLPAIMQHVYQGLVKFLVEHRQYPPELAATKFDDPSFAQKVSQEEHKERERC